MAQCKTTLFENSIWRHNDVKQADLLFTYDEELAEIANRVYFNNQTLQKACAIGSAKLEALFKKHQSLRVFAPKRPTIMFVISLLYGNGHRSNWTDLHTFTLQQKIVDAFSHFPQINFIIKGLADSDAIYNPLPEYIREMAYFNCKYIDHGKFTKLMKHANAFIFDFGSTAMIEAMATNKTIILYNDNLKPLPRNVELLKKRVHLISGIKQLKKIIKKYCISNQDRLADNKEYLMKYIMPQYHNGGAAKVATEFILNTIK